MVWQCAGAGVGRVGAAPGPQRRPLPGHPQRIGEEEEEELFNKDNSNKSGPCQVTLCG